MKKMAEMEMCSKSEFENASARYWRFRPQWIVDPGFR